MISKRQFEESCQELESYMFKYTSLRFNPKIKRNQKHISNIHLGYCFDPRRVDKIAEAMKNRPIDGTPKPQRQEGTGTKQLED